MTSASRDARRRNQAHRVGDWGHERQPINRLAAGVWLTIAAFGCLVYGGLFIFLIAWLG